jgi:hypothetical protein
VTVVVHCQFDGKIYRSSPFLTFLHSISGMDAVVTALNMPFRLEIGAHSAHGSYKPTLVLPSDLMIVAVGIIC